MTGIKSGERLSAILSAYIDFAIYVTLPISAIFRQIECCMDCTNFKLSTQRRVEPKIGQAGNGIGHQYEAIEDAVLTVLGTTHRCSSMIENLNSRVRPYLDERKSVSQKTLSLIQFYLNHKPFMRSQHEYLKDKTPAEY